MNPSLFIAAGLLVTPLAAAAQSLDAIPNVPEKVQVCSLGKYTYDLSAAEYAKKVGLPQPITNPAIFDVLARKVIETCDDGQKLELGDVVGVPDVPAYAHKLFSKFCEQKDILVAPMTDADTRFTRAKRWTCPISKLGRIKEMLVQKQKG